MHEHASLHTNLKGSTTPFRTIVQGEGMRSVEMLHAARTMAAGHLAGVGKMSREQLIQAARKAEEEARRSPVDVPSPNDVMHEDEEEGEQEEEEPLIGSSTASEWRSALRGIFEQALFECESTSQRRLLADLEEQVIQQAEVLRGRDERHRDAVVRAAGKLS